MNKKVMSLNIEMVARQRNLFLILSVMSVLSSMMLAYKVLTSEEKTILVPGLNQEVWTNKDGVSSSYLEEVSSMYIPFLLDLDSGCIDWKREKLFKYVSRSDAVYIKSLANYFASAKKQYSQFSLSTHFAVKNFKINQKDLTVEAHGQLTSHFGERGVTSMPAIYRLSFEWVSGRLLLTEFVKLSKDESGVDRVGDEREEIEIIKQEVLDDNEE
ncbi:MAG: hypothetical protein KA998_00150 [Rickettsiaceae bacterium]|nr:hypothetical protein [Rickettsiaceae bacterium]